MGGHWLVAHARPEAGCSQSVPLRFCSFLWSADSGVSAPVVRPAAPAGTINVTIGGESAPSEPTTAHRHLTIEEHETHAVPSLDRPDKDWTLLHPLWKDTYVGQVTYTHLPPQTLIDKLALWTIKTIRFNFDWMSVSRTEWTTSALQPNDPNHPNLLCQLVASLPRSFLPLLSFTWSGLLVRQVDRAEGVDAHRLPRDGRRCAGIGRRHAATPGQLATHATRWRVDRIAHGRGGERAHGQ